MAILTGFEYIVRENESLAPFTWLRLGGAAQYFAEPTNSAELQGLMRAAHQPGLPVRVLGGGSNLLVRDTVVPGLVLHLAAAAFGKIEVSGRSVTAGGGARLGHVISSAVREGLAGLEPLVGIPGTVGGALRTNAGSHAGDVGQFVASVTLVSSQGELATRRRQDLRFAYRDSNLDDLILDATFELEPGDVETLTKRMQQLWILKKSAQPLSDQNAGCIFKNPGGISAASLIEEAGLKNARVGDAEVSERCANFIVAGRRASSQEVLDLIELIRTGVAERTGAELETAIEIW